MKLVFVFGFVAAGFLFSSDSIAQDKACLIEGTMEIMGKTIYSKDCMQADPNEDENKFKNSCEKLAQAGMAFGGKPGKVTYLPACIKPSQGICVGMAGSRRDAYYYARSAEDLITLPKSCEMMGGKWTSGK